VTASQPPNPAQPSNSDVEVSSTEGERAASVNSAQGLVEASPADVDVAAEAELAPVTDVDSASDAGAESSHAPVLAVSSSGRDVQSQAWLRGSSPRRLRLIDRQLRTALGLQGIVVIVVLSLWLLGKLSWNHDPLTSQRFRPLELPALTNRAQNAALEFHHDLVTGEFGQARLLVVEEAEKLVEDAAAACRDASPCASKERVFTRATLIRTVGQEARAFVESFAADGRPVGDATYNLSHASGRWLVTDRVAQ
jgi:hypothetical protein